MDQGTRGPAGAAWTRHRCYYTQRKVAASERPRDATGPHKPNTVYYLCKDLSLFFPLQNCICCCPMSEEKILTALAFRIFQVAPTALVYFSEEHVANLCIVSEVVLTDNPSQSHREDTRDTSNSHHGWRERSSSSEWPGFTSAQVQEEKVNSIF